MAKTEHAREASIQINQTDQLPTLLTQKKANCISSNLLKSLATPVKTCWEYGFDMTFQIPPGKGTCKNIYAIQTAPC